jgi:ubiquilin
LCYILLFKKGVVVGRRHEKGKQRSKRARQAVNMSSEESFEINVRQTTGGTFAVGVTGSMLVLDLKTKLSTECDATRGVETERMRLIYQGHVLKDDKTLESYGIKPNHTVHFVKGVVSQGQREAQGQRPSAVNNNNNAQGDNNGNNNNNNANAFTSPFGSFGGFGGGNNNGGGDLGGLGGFGGLDIGGGYDQQSMQRMEQQLMSNPQLVQDMLDSPVMQSMMNNPEMLRTMIENNPQMREVMDRNPELRHIMSDPETLRQTFEIARNPSLMREQMRTTDRAMSNLETMPEGFNMLRRMYENVQEPLMNATNQSNRSESNNQAGSNNNTTNGSATGANANANSNPFAALRNNNNSSQNSETSPNTSPLPNPWAPTQPPAAQQQQQRNNHYNGGNNGGTAFNPFSGMFGGGAGAGNGGGNMGGLGGMGMDPAAMQRLLQDQPTRNMMQSMLSQPGSLERILGSANPQMREAMEANPQMREALNNPDLIRQMMDPANVQAMMQMQQAMQQLQSSGLLGSMGGGGGGGGAAAALGGLGGAFGGLGGGFPSFAGANTNTESNNNSSIPPEQLYESQLRQLQDMGFSNQEQNIAALRQVGGNVNAAVDRLLSGL